MIAKPLPGDWSTQEAWDNFWNTYEVPDMFDPTQVPIKPRQHPYEIYHFLKVLQKVDIKQVLEIGTYKGGTLWFWLNYLNPKGLDRVVCIDDRSEDYSYDPLGSTEYLSLWESWCGENTELIFLCGNSICKEVNEEVVELAEEASFDFLFIDGKHTVEQVREDFRLYSPLVRSGGVIAIHDSANENVRPFCMELSQTHPYQEIVSPITPLGIGWVIKD